MNKIKLTKSVIDSIPYITDGAKTTHYWDTELKGFGLRVGRETKAFFVQRDINSKTYVRKVGPYGIFTPEEARKIARNKLNMLAQGIDPDESERQLKVKGMTLRELMEEYFSVRKNLKKVTKASYRNYLKCHVSDWMDRPVTEITEEKILKRYSLIGERTGHTSANCVRRTLSAMLGYGMAGHKLFDKNPVRIIAETKAAYRENRRDGHLKPHQLKPWHEAVARLHNSTYAHYLQLVLFTGLRKTEALSLRWSQIDFNHRSLKILETKNGDPLTLPMSDFVYDLLKQRRELVPGSLYVFPTCSGKGHLADPKKGVAAVVEATSIPFQIHDLRRTFASIASSLDISVYSIKALLNHRNTDITGSYVIRDVERLRQPMQQIATYIQQQITAEA